MKTLTTLLLLASFSVMGQSELIKAPNGNKILYHRGESFVLSDKEYAIMDFVVQSNIIQNSFLMYSDQLKIWFKDYKRECWNDSTEIDKMASRIGVGCGHRNCIIGKDSSQDCMKIRRDGTIKRRVYDVFGPCIHPEYRHRPPTFEGFMQWVEKKSK
jgi:hypothetical protein